MSGAMAAPGAAPRYATIDPRRAAPAKGLGLVGAARLLLVGTPAERPWTNALLVFVPFVFLSYAWSWSSGATFALSLVALIPLAERLGFCTECLSEYTSDTFAGLINATMGNAPELLIAIFALRSSSLRIVQISLLGSVLLRLALEFVDRRPRR